MDQNQVFHSLHRLVHVDDRNREWSPWRRTNMQWRSIVWASKTQSSKHQPVQMTFHDCLVDLEIKNPEEILQKNLFLFGIYLDRIAYQYKIKYNWITAKQNKKEKQKGKSNSKDRQKTKERKRLWRRRVTCPFVDIKSMWVCVSIVLVKFKFFNEKKPRANHVRH